MADLAGKAASTELLARLAEVLAGQMTATAKEIAKLVDETIPSEPVVSSFV